MCIVKVYASGGLGSKSSTSSTSPSPTLSIASRGGMTTSALTRGASINATNPTTSWTRSAQTDFYGSGNFQTLRAQNFSIDMGIVRAASVGSTVELRFSNGTRTYARKVAPNSWKTDAGKILSDNSIASTAHDGGRVELNTLIHKK